MASIRSFEMFNLVAAGDDQPRYKHFLSVGQFHKFSVAPSGETTDRIKKVRGSKMVRVCSITMPNMVEIVRRSPAVDENV